MVTQPTTRRHQQAKRNPDSVRLAILFICAVSVTLLIVSAVVEHTSPFLVLFPTAVGAWMIAGLRR